MECVAARRTRCLMTSGPETGVSPEAIDVCAESLAGASCRPTALRIDYVYNRVDEVPAAVVTGACETPPGKLEEGATCTEDAQCATLLCTPAPLQTSACGKCAARPGEGQRCQYYHCADGLRCGTVPAATGGTIDVCMRVGNLGDPCAVSDSGFFSTCATGLSCVDTRCVPDADLGRPCGIFDGVSPDCRASKGLYCSPASHTCARLPSRPVTVGEPCAWPDGPRCRGDLICVEGRCERLPREGEACWMRSSCQAPATCEAYRVCRVITRPDCR
jgi:hypothetical protein